MGEYIALPGEEPLSSMSTFNPRLLNHMRTHRSCLQREVNPPFCSQAHALPSPLPTQHCTHAAAVSPTLAPRAPVSPQE